MRRARYFALSLAVSAAWLIGLPTALADAPSGSQWLAGAAPQVSKALAGPKGAEARVALDALAARGQVNSDHMAKLLGKPEFAGMAKRTLVALAKVDGVEGVSSVVKRLAKADSPRRLIGPVFELEVAASFGADKVKGVGVYVDGHEVDVVLRDGTQVEAKHFPKNNPEVFGLMLDKSIEQLSLRSQAGKKPVMLVSNQPLAEGQLQAVRKGLGPGASVVVVNRRGTRTTQIAGRSLQQQRQQLARKSSRIRSKSQVAKRSPHLLSKSRAAKGAANTRGLGSLDSSRAKAGQKSTSQRLRVIGRQDATKSRRGATRPLRARKVRGR